MIFNDIFKEIPILEAPLYINFGSQETWLRSAALTLTLRLSAKSHFLLRRVYKMLLAIIF